LTNPALKVLVCTTFAERHWNAHANRMIASFDQYWPAAGLFVELDDERLFDQLLPVINRRGGALGTLQNDQRYQKFKTEWGEKDHPTDYRRQFFRFSHKVFALSDAMVLAANAGYDAVVWLDADVWTNSEVPEQALAEWLPREDEVATYLGRRDWPHSECGFLAFNMRRPKQIGLVFMDECLERFYVNGEGANAQQSDDSWLFDVLRKDWEGRGLRFRNLTPDVAGMHVWPASPLGPYMTHHKGPVAKQQLPAATAAAPKPALANVVRGVGSKSVPLDIKIRNCLPHDEIRRNVSDNLALIPQWVPECRPTNESVIMASGGPRLDVDKVAWYARRGHRVVCVKHSLERLLSANVVPWACVLLDPRVHVENFVHNPDRRVNYLVASMVDPRVTMRLLENKCPVWGYHAAVGADEQQYVARGTPYISYGSASAVRGMFVMKALGFSRFHLMGYDLCHFVKPDLSEKLPDGNKKYLEAVLEQLTWGGGKAVRTFWTEGQLLAQAQEIERIASEKMLTLTAEGDGVVPWILEHQRRYKAWNKTVYARPAGPKPAADNVIKGRPWTSRALTLARTLLLPNR
jgi:hypothetical protein